MIQLIVNVNLLREIDERKLINAYAKKIYESKVDVEDDDIIKINLTKLFDWDINGDNGLGIYCGKFESLKRKDWERLIQFIKDNKYEIEKISRTPLKEKHLENIKIIIDFLEAREKHNVKRFTDENYQVSGRGKKARPCIYKGKEYKSRQECIYKEGITKHQLYNYLKETEQL